MLWAIIIVTISLLLDGLLTNYLPYLVNDLSLFTPLLTVVSLYIVYPYFYKNNKKYFIFAFIFGMLYDLFYTNLLFFNSLIFLLIAFITMKLTKNIQINAFNILYEVILIIIIYETVFALSIVIFNLVPVTFTSVLYKISHTILLNVIYVELIYLIMKNFNNKYSKKRLN